MNVDPKFVVELQGKQFITYDGLLSLAHNMGLLSIKTELVKHDSEITIFRATARTEGQEFDGHGDATPQNVNSMIAKHRLRMAETRAKARALRDLTNVGMVAVEELGGDDARPDVKAKPDVKPEPKAAALASLTGLVKEMEIDNEYVKALREELFPGTKNVKDLTTGQIVALEVALLKGDGENE